VLGLCEAKSSAEKDWALRYWRLVSNRISSGILLILQQLPEQTPDFLVDSLETFGMSVAEGKAIRVEPKVVLRIPFIAQSRHQYVRIIWNAYTVPGQKP
jgi:hypothetical protein